MINRVWRLDFTPQTFESVVKGTSQLEQLPVVSTKNSYLSSADNAGKASTLANDLALMTIQVGTYFDLLYCFKSSSK